MTNERPSVAEFLAAVSPVLDDLIRELEETEKDRDAALELLPERKAYEEATVALTRARAEHPLSVRYKELSEAVDLRVAALKRHLTGEGYW